MAVIEVSTSGQVAVGGTLSVTLQNRSNAAVRGQLAFDTTMLQSAGVDKGDRLDVVLEPSGQQVFVLRALVGTAGKSSQVQLEGLNAVSVTGAVMPVRVDGDGSVSFIAR